MAVLGKIRSRGALLVGIIGLGLFAFIAEEAVRSCESTKNNERQQVAQVLGEKISYQEFQEMVDEYQDAIKMTQGRDNLSEDELNQVRDMVWQQYVQNAVIAREAKELGLKVTDDEIRDILNQGTNQMLMQTPFVNQQTGRFDANSLKQFVAEYKKAQQTNPQQAEQMRPIYNYWNFVEKNLRQQLLSQKYQTLLAATFVSNSVEAKQTFAEENEEATIQLAALPYSSVADKDIQISDDDLKAKYKEMKAAFKQYEETRDIKYVSVKVQASAADRAAISKQTQEYVQQLATAEDPSEIVRKSGSVVAYLGVPVMNTAFPNDVVEILDSVPVGTTTQLKENKQDGTLTAVRFMSKQELPDSVEFQVIQVDGETLDAAHTRADSIVKALTADATQWDALAKKYNQTGAKQWLTTKDYQNANSLDVDTKAYINALNTMQAGEMKNLATNSGNIIIKVTDRKSFQTKYLAAVIKTPINFSKETYSQAYNKFSQYVSENQTIESLEKNAKKFGYQVLENQDVRSSQHNIAGIHGTHEALKWVYESEENMVSPLYECGENDNLLVIALTKIHKKGYRDLDDEQVKEMVKAEVLADKKAEKLIAKVAGVKNIAGAKAKGAQVVDVNQVTFASPVFVVATGASEPALSGAVAATKKGQFSKAPVKGNAAVYLFQVTKKQQRQGQKYDAKAIMQRIAQRNMQAAGNFMQELIINSDIKDNRVMFF
ncbi:MAG: SurA N-terminal domain-containing protein [Prevotella sp.]|nr:SurA N-terminal domain-containing protein [Prevotella sp.]